MKCREFILCVLTLAAAADLSLAALKEAEALAAGEPVLLARPLGHAGAIDRLELTVLSTAEPEEASEVFDGLRESAVKQLLAAGVEVLDGTGGGGAGELRIEVDALMLAGCDKYVFRARTALAARVLLAEKPTVALRADIWNAGPVIKAAGTDGGRAALGDMVAAQVEAFIAARGEAAVSSPPAQEVPAAEQYISSVKSSVFHRSGCASVSRIKPGNMRSYAGRSEAIRAGKRPCRRCKP
jgi:hypothetical protein